MNVVSWFEIPVKDMSRARAFGPWGFIAHVVDTEGNRVGLASPK